MIYPLWCWLHWWHYIHLRESETSEFVCKLYPDFCGISYETMFKVGNGLELWKGSVLFIVIPYIHAWYHKLFRKQKWWSCPFSCNLLQKFGSQIFNFFFLLRSVDQKFRKLSMHVNVFIVYCFKQNHYYIHIYRYLGYWNCKQYWYCRLAILTYL